MPLWIFIQIRKITVCNIGEIDLGHLRSIAIRKKLLINSVAAMQYTSSAGYFSVLP